MRFILGLLIGIGIGFAASVLFAPQREEEEAAERADDAGANGAGAFKSAFDSLRKQLDEALSEAKKAQREAEEKMTKRFREVVGRAEK